MTDRPGLGGAAQLCALLVVCSIGLGDAAQCDTTTNACDLIIESMSLNLPSSLKPGTETIEFNVGLKNDDPNNDIDPAPVGGTKINFDCTMRYASTDIGVGAPVTDPFETKPENRKFSTDCISGDIRLKAGLYSQQTRTLTGSCALTLPQADCKDAKYLCLDCTVPTAPPATFNDKKTTNNKKCVQIDTKLTCDIDIELVGDINPLCVGTPKIRSGKLQTVMLPKLTIKNNEPAIQGSKQNNIKANTGNFKFEVILADKGVSLAPANILVTVTQPNATSSIALEASKTETITMTINYTIPHDKCHEITHVCLKLSKGSTTTYAEDLSTDAEKDNNIKCCDINSVKLCRSDPKVNSVAINTPVTFKADAADINTVLDVVLENLGEAPIAAAGGAGAENFKFEQFFSKADCNSAQIHPAPPETKCQSTVTGTSTTAKNGGIAYTPTGGGTNANRANFKIECFMSLTSAVCGKMTKICVKFLEGTGATYNDKDTTNNCECTTVTITKQCKPNVVAVSLLATGGPVTDYRPVTSAIDFQFTIENDQPSPASDIAPATDNFRAECSMTKTNKTKLVGPAKEVPPTTNKDAGLAKNNINNVVLELSVIFESLLTTECKAVKYFCCRVFAPDPPKNYDEEKTDDNTACIAATAANRNCKPVFLTFSPPEISVKENEPSGTSVFKLPYEDGNGDTPTVIKFKQVTVNKLFTVDADGVIRTVGTFDFETAPTKTHTIEYTVEDADGPNGAISTGTVTIKIVDVNEKPTLTADDPPNPASLTSGGVSGSGSGATISIPEKFSGDIRTIFVTDVDAGDTKAIFKNSWTHVVTTPSPAPGTRDPFSTKGNNDGDGILSVKPGILDYSKIQQYVVKVKACDDGVPQPGGVQCGEIDITINVLKNKVPPKWDKTTFRTVSIKENETKENKGLITLTAIDEDTNDLLFKMQCNPATKIFKYSPTAQSGKQMTISHQANPNPGFDYETTKTYKCYVFVMDGFHMAVMDVVTINIIDLNEKPKMKLPPQPLGATYPEINVPELHCYGCHLYDFECTDEDANQKVTKSMKIYDTPFDLQAKSKFQLDPLGRVLLNFNNNILHKNVDKYLAVFSCCDDFTPQKCDIQNVTLRVEKYNRPPIFSPNTTGITVYEGKEGKGDTDLNFFDKFKDPEGTPPTSCGILDSRFSNYFKITGKKLEVGEELDYDTYKPPHHFYITIECSDTVVITPPRTDSPKVRPLKTQMLVEVNVLGVDDNPPVFPPTEYTATLFEDAFSTQSVVRVSATDNDLGVHGQMTYQLDPTNALANELFTIVKISNEEAEVRCRGGLDVEKYSSVTFEIHAVSPGPPKKLTGTATVTVYIRNVNDLRPQWVTPDYINLEISTTAEVGKLMTTVNCTDADILYNDVNYDQISTTFGGADYFKTDVYSGEVRSNHTPYEEDDRYFVRIVCKDTDPKVDFSGIAIVRIDTYVNWKHVTNWTLCKPMADYQASDQEAFLASVATLCPPCIPKIHNITEKDGKAVFHLYFIKDNTTYAKNAREYDKVFLETDDIMERYYDEKLHAPKKGVTDDPVFGGCLLNITRFADEPKENWFLDTIAGNFMIGFLMSLGFMLLMTAVICCARKAAPGRVRIPDTPRGARPKKPPTATPKPKPPEEKPKKQNKRPKTPESESDESDEQPAKREPTPKPTRRKFDKFV